MSTDPMLDATRAVAAFGAAMMRHSAEPLTLNDALRVIRANVELQLPPATAKLLKRLAKMDVAGTLPIELRVYLLDVARELLANAAMPPAVSDAD